MTFREKQAVWFVGAVLFAAAFAYSLLFIIPEEASRDQPKGAAGAVLAEGAEAVIHYLLEDGHVASTEVASLPSELVGLTASELRAARPGWHILTFASERVVVSVPCGPIRTASGFIGVRDGKVTVFRGKPDGCHEVREVTDIDAEELPGTVHEQFGETIPYEDPAELPFILEGLRGHTL